MKFLSESVWTNRIGLPLLHIGAILGLLTATPTLPILMVAALLYVLRGFGITVGYHRLYTHGAFHATRPTAFALAFLGGLAGQGSMSWWVYRHRTHHRYTDREGDPHSPRVGGFYHAHMGWLFRRATAEDRAGENALRSEWSREVQILDRWMPILYLLQGALLFLLGGWAMLAWGFFIPSVVSLHFTFLVNSLCHRLGDRPFDTQDDSRNNRYFAALMFGEGWHNNHHAWPKNARLGLRPSQLDMGYAFIKLLEKFGLVSDLVEKTESEIRASVKRYTPQEKRDNSSLGDKSSTASLLL